MIQLSNIKETIKQKIPFLKSLNKAVKSFYYAKKRAYLNRSYDKSISKLYNPDVLSDRLNALNNLGKKHYYIIATENSRLGIYGYINCFLPHIAYAVEHGLIPVIDMKNYASIYQKDNENVWELFYEQPMQSDFDSLKNEDILYCPTDFWYHNLPSSYPVMSEESIYMWSSLYSAMIKYNKLSQKYLDNELKSILLYPDKTIGVIYRGTTYTRGAA